MCDLAWTRSLRLRQALAQIFDAENIAALHYIKSVKITHAPGARSSAVLVLGWLAAQLGWSAHGPSGNHLRMEGEHGAVTCEVSEAEGAVISRVELISEQLAVTASRIAGVPFLNISAKSADGRSTEFIMPADGESAADTLNDELGSWGLHRVYSKALTAAETLL